MTGALGFDALYFGRADYQVSHPAVILHPPRTFNAAMQCNLHRLHSRAGSCHGWFFCVYGCRHVSPKGCAVDIRSAFVIGCPYRNAHVYDVAPFRPLAQRSLSIAGHGHHKQQETS